MGAGGQGETSFDRAEVLAMLENIIWDDQGVAAELRNANINDTIWRTKNLARTARGIADLAFEVMEMTADLGHNSGVFPPAGGATLVKARIAGPTAGEANPFLHASRAIASLANGDPALARDFVEVTIVEGQPDRMWEFAFAVYSVYLSVARQAKEPPMIQWQTPDVVGFTARAIYVLTDANAPERGIRYVGSAYDSAEARFSAHRLAAKTGTTRVYQWMRAVGIEGIRMEVIDTLPEGATTRELLALETRYSRYLRTMKGDMVNVSEPLRLRTDSPLPPTVPMPPKPLPEHLTVGFWESPLIRPASSPREAWTLDLKRSTVTPHVSPGWRQP